MTTHEGAVSTQPDAGGLDVIATIAIQVVVAISVWGLVGLLVDLLLGTGPWVQFGGLLLGTMIALVLSQRRATSLAESEPSDG